MSTWRAPVTDEPAGEARGATWSQASGPAARGARAAGRANDLIGAEGRDPIRSAWRWAGVFAIVLLGLSGLVGIGVVRPIDDRALEAVQSVACYPLDLAASLIGVVGQTEVTAPIAVILAFFWWRRRGLRGLVPLLLFAGVAIEVVLKHVVPQPSPPPDLSRSLHLLPFLKAASPYSFPSGHVLRTTFLAALIADRTVFWAVVVAMSLSRVYLAEHWTSDVIGGLLVGLMVSGVAAAIYGGGSRARR